MHIRQGIQGMAAEIWLNDEKLTREEGLLNSYTNHAILE